MSVALAAGLAGETLAQATGVVRGRIVVSVDGVVVPNTGAIAAYLEPASGEADFAVPREPRIIEQKNARFKPSFSIITVGQKVQFPNRDNLLHNVFSFSKANSFELGLYASGKSRTIEMKHPGIVRIYCSIHESMRAVVLVSPTPWYAIADASGAFEIRGVTPGNYRIITFNEPLPAAIRMLRVAAGESSFVQIEIGAQE